MKKGILLVACAIVCASMALMGQYNGGSVTKKNPGAVCLGSFCFNIGPLGTPTYGWTADTTKRLTFLNSFYGGLYVNGTEANTDTAAPNLNSATPAADSGYTACTWKTAGANVICEFPSQASGTMQSFGSGLVELVTYNGVNALSGEGDILSACASATSTSVAVTATSPGLFNSASLATAGDCAGWTGGQVYWGARQPKVAWGLAFSASTDYSSARVWFGIGHGCIVTTLNSDTPSCNLAAIRYSTVAGDSTYECVTSTGGANTVTPLTGASPSTTYTAMAINWGTSAITCTVGAVSVTNTTNLPTTAAGYSDFFMDITQSAAAVNLRFNGVYGISQNGTF